MALVSTSRRQVSEVVKTVVPFQHDYGIDYSYARVNAQGTLDINPIGTILIYNGTSTDWEVYVAQTIATEAAKSQAANELPNQAIMCITVGTGEGVGKNEANVTLTASDQEFTVIYRGPAGISQSAIDANGANAGALTAAFLQFEKQGLASVADSTVVVPSFVL